MNDMIIYAAFYIIGGVGMMILAYLVGRLYGRHYTLDHMQELRNELIDDGWSAAASKLQQKINDLS